MPQIALAAYSIYQGVQAGKSAEASGRAAAAARQQQQAVGAEEQQYWRQKYGPVNDMLLDYAMGNKPSPYLAAAKGKVETGYQQGVTQLNELQGRAGLQQSGIGLGQKIGLNMERAKAEAGLNLADQAQRYGVAQSLAPMLQNSTKGAAMASGALEGAASDATRNAAGASAAASSAFGSAMSNFGSFAEQYGMNGSGGDNSVSDIVGRGPTTTTSVTGQNMGSTQSGDYGYNQSIGYGDSNRGALPGIGVAQAPSPSIPTANPYALTGGKS